MLKEVNKKTLILIAVGICVIIAMICNSNNSNIEEEISTTEEYNTTIENLTTEEVTTEDIPYVGMLESDISSTALGVAHCYGGNHIKTNNGYERSDIYDYYDEKGYTIFIINVVNGRVYRVSDYRDRPWNRRKISNKTEKTDKETTSVRWDPYDAQDYDVDDYEDFYDDNYDDFEDIDEAADYLEEYWDEYE